ncbi:MAG: phosphatase PAP2 family protein [Melioribacteraceae bacterium]|nr:phosphatase PAP2 family protein [Melioribacteraceae bacterium]
MRKLYIYRLFIVMLLFPILVHSQNNYDWKQFWSETGDYYSAPASWDKNDFITFGLIAVTTFGIMQFDDSIKDEVANINSNQKNWLMEAGRYWGEPIPSIALSGLLLIHGYTSNDTKTKKLGFEIGQSFFYSATITGGLKIIFGRSRPNTGLPSTSYSPFSFSDSNWSHPSGHTTIAFSLSTVLAANTNNDALKVAAFIPALLTAASRVYQNHHWTSDVFLGAMIGYFTGKFVTDLHKQNEVTPFLNSTPLVSLSLAF